MIEHKNLISTVALGVVLPVVLTACGGSGGDAATGTEGGHTAGGDAPSQYQGAIASTDVAHGEEVFGQACAPCHEGSAPSLEGLGWTPGEVRRQVREGEGQMPAFPASRVPDADLEAVLAYLQTIGGVAP